jgi:hypothetical protein
MIKQLVGGLAGVAVFVGLAASAHAADANCDFSHPSKAKKFQGYFVQAFVPCGGLCFGGANEGRFCPQDSACPGGVCRAVVGGKVMQPETFPSTSTALGGALFACQPPETFNEQAGGPPTGWLWGPKTQAKIQFKALAKPGNPTVTPADAADLVVQVKAKDIEQVGFVPADGTEGNLEILSRTTLTDRTNGSVTAADFLLNVRLPVFGGKINVKTSVDQQLNSVENGGLDSLPHCTSIEILSVVMQDELSHNFGTLGVLLP